MALSRRAYAAHRKAKGLPGGSESAVRKAISSGRISIGAGDLIDAEVADAEWAAVTDPSQQRSSEAQAQGLQRSRETVEANEHRPVPLAAVEAVNNGAADAGDTLGSGGVTFAKARAAEMAIRAQRSSLLLKRLKGEVVDRGPAEAHVFSLARGFRDHMMQLPARVAAQVASELEIDAHAVEVIMDRVIREHLALLSESKIDLRAAQV